MRNDTDENDVGTTHTHEICTTHILTSTRLECSIYDNDERIGLCIERGPTMTKDPD